MEDKVDLNQKIKTNSLSGSESSGSLSVKARFSLLDGFKKLKPLKSCLSYQNLENDDNDEEWSVNNLTPQAQEDTDSAVSENSSIERLPEKKIRVNNAIRTAKKQTRLKVWSYFIQLSNFSAQCNLCNKIYNSVITRLTCEITFHENIQPKCRILENLITLPIARKTQFLNY